MNDTPALDNPLENLIGYQVRRASAVIMNDMGRSFGELGLTVAEASILQLIERNPDIIQSAVGAALGIKRANTAPLIADLTEKALIERSRADGRSQHLRLTDKGKDVVAQVYAHVAAHETRLCQDASPEERARLIGFLSSIWKSQGL